MDGTPATVDILIVDDDEADILLMEEALEEGKLKVEIHTARDGIEALEFLRKQGRFADAVTPDLIFLDLNMPRKDGREVLKEMKQDKHLCHLPVVILTTSKEDEEVFRAYESGANCYITKPVGMEEFTKVVRSLEDFWFTIARIPKKGLQIG